VDEKLERITGHSVDRQSRHISPTSRKEEGEYGLLCHQKIDMHRRVEMALPLGGNATVVKKIKA
jgi:hypothetical protein